MIDSSTIDPAVSKDMAKLAKTHKSTYLDAPVSGGKRSTNNFFVVNFFFGI